jgi:hypothetical protein
MCLTLIGLQISLGSYKQNVAAKNSGVMMSTLDQSIHFETLLPGSAEAAYSWHERPGALERLTPPWENVLILSRDAKIQDGARVEVRVRIGPLRKSWIAEHYGTEPGRCFRDRQLGGPFALWEHTHTMTSADGGMSKLEDDIVYRLPFGRIGLWFGGSFVRSKLERMFRYRHRLTKADLAAHGRFQESHGRMKVLVSGAGGLVGAALCPFLTTGEHEVVRLRREKSVGDDRDATWDVAAKRIDADKLEGLDAVVHLAGENIAGGRWNTTRKKKIRDSRIEGTRLLCETLAALESPPKTLVCASAIGYYGDRGDELLDESSDIGEGFLSEVCRDWEAATEPARQAGIRVVNLRFGVILSPKGGALASMLLPFRFGAGGVVGSGRQYWSWIAIDDVIGAIQHTLMTDNLVGPVNCVAPEPATNREFTKTLGRVLRRPTIFPLPAFAARFVLGEMADALLLCSARVDPQQLQQAGYEFRCPTLEDALRHLLGR